MGFFDEMSDSVKEKVLELLYQQAESFRSGQEISEHLGISRTAVWKHIRALVQDGYTIETGHRKGYCLRRQEDALLPQEIQARLTTSWLGSNILHHDTLDSTNVWAKEQAQKLGHGTVVVAEEQTKGRGRMGRPWESKKGEGIWMTLVLKPELPMSEGGKITQMAAVAMQQAIVIETGLPVKIKWPNDLLVEEKKLCGILTEMSGELTQIDTMYIGVGVNVNQQFFEGELATTATSVSIESGKVISRSRLMAAFLGYFERHFDSLVNHGHYDAVLQVARDQSSLLGKSIHVIRGPVRLPATARALHEDGRLEVEFADGRRELMAGGEVSVRKLTDE